MKREDAVPADPQLDKVQQEITNASHAPGYVYASPEVYQWEIDHLFMKEWLYVGREEELPNPGDYMTMRLVGEPVIIARALDGTLSAFYNMCKHRGVEVAYGSGNERAFKCPYHGWTYDLKGKLRGASFMQDCAGFDPTNVRMEPIRFGTWRRNMFICFSHETPPLEQWIADFEKDFAFLHMEKCRLGNKTVIELECNWKLAYENLMDFYHVKVLHAKTFGATFAWNKGDMELKNSGVSLWYKAGPPTPNAEPLLGKMPWMQDRDYSFASEGYMRPNFTLFGRVDCARPFIVWPLSESRCRIIAYQCFPEEVFARPDIREVLKVYENYLLRVIEEDRVMIESLQKAMSSRGFRPGRMSVMEQPIHHVLNQYIHTVFKDRKGRADA